MADVQGLLADPQFQGLDPASKKSVLSRVDPAFSNLSDADFSQFMTRIGATTPPMPKPPIPSGLQGPDKPLWQQTLSNLPGSIVNAAMHPTALGMPMGQPSDAYVKGPDGKYHENIKPWKGVGQELSDFGSSLIDPFMHPVDDPAGFALNVAGAGNMIRKSPIPAVTGGAIKGGVKGSLAPVPIKIPGVDATVSMPAALAGAGGGALGGSAGSFWGHGIEGALGGGVVGGLAPGVKGAFKGGAKGLSDWQAAQRVGQNVTPIWEGGSPAPAPLFPEPIGPIQQPQFNPRQPAAQRAGRNITPIWESPGIPQGSPSMFPESIGPIQQPQFNPRSVVPPPVPTPRPAPAWMDAPSIQTNLPDLSPIPQQAFPSGRLPGPAPATQNVPRPPVWERGRTAPAAQSPISPVSPSAQPSVPPVVGPSIAGVPATAPGASDLFHPLHLKGAQAMAENAAAKDLKMGQYFTDLGLTPDQIRAMPDADLNAHLKTNGFRPPNPKLKTNRPHSDLKESFIKNMGL